MRPPPRFPPPRSPPPPPLPELVSGSHILEDLVNEARDHELSRAVGAYTTRDALTALLYRLAKEEMGWGQLAKVIQELVASDAYVLSNKGMAEEAIRLAALLRGKR